MLQRTVITHLVLLNLNVQGKNLELNSETLIPSGTIYPQRNFISDYDNGNLDDTIRYMVVEKCSGDLQILFNFQADKMNKGFISKEEFDETWFSIMAQISITVYILNDIINPFYHNDFGCRNVLYTDNLLENTFFKYQFKDKVYNIKNVGIVPKLWDFNYMFIDQNIANNLSKREEFDYLSEHDEFKTVREEGIPCIVQLCESIMSMENFSYIKNTNFCEFVTEVSRTRCDDFSIIMEFLDNFVPTENDILLEPVFIYQ